MPADWARDLPTIPEELLPRPRLVIWHGDLETDDDAAPLEVLRRAYDAVISHGFATGISAGGSDWSGWHLAGDPAYVDGLAHVARSLARPWWRIVDDAG